MTDRMPIRMIGLAVALAITASCRLPKPAWKAPTAIECHRLAGGITDRDRRGAMISVHAHSYWPLGDFPDHLRPMTLDQAARVLFCDTERAAASRRHRAVAKLAVYLFDAPGGFDAPTDVRSIVQGLGADLGELQALIHRSRRLYHESRSIGARDRERYVSNRLKLQQVGSQTDCPQVEDQGAGVYGPGVDFVIGADARVELGVQDVARILDPQSWDECSPLFESDTIMMVAKGTGYDCASWSPDSVGEPLGDPYDRVVFERFNCDAQGIDVQFENFLGVETWTDNPYPPKSTGIRYNAEYDWKLQCSGTVAGIPSQLKKDDGHIWAMTDVSDPDWSYVHFEKIIQFENPAHTGSAQALLAGLELAEQVRDMMCCQP